MHGSHKKRESSPQEKEEEQEKPKQEAPLSSGNFPFYNDRNIYGMGCICSQLKSAAVANSKLLMACRLRLACDSIVAKLAQYSAPYPLPFPL